MIRLTTVQALVKFLNQQYINVDGKEQRLFKGIFTIFGHGNVLGLGQALEENPGELEVYQGRNEQGMAHAATAFAKQNHRKQLIACTSSDRKSTRLNSSHVAISYAVFCLKKKS